MELDQLSKALWEMSRSAFCLPMTEEIQTPTRTKILRNGAVYDLDKGRIVANPGGGNSAFTPETSLKAKERLAELKREAVIRGAARALEKTGEWDTPSDVDVIEAISEAVTMKALNPDNPKQVDAARFVFQESGMAESQPKPSDSDQQFAEISGALFAVLDVLRDAIQPREIVDGTVTDANDTRNE